MPPGRRPRTVAPPIATVVRLALVHVFFFLRDGHVDRVTLHPNLTAIPYGLQHYYLREYATVLINTEPTVKQETLIVPNFEAAHHSSRRHIKSVCKLGKSNAMRLTKQYI